MLYLASKFVWFLLAAFGMGLGMGWLTRPGSGRPWSRSLGVLAILWALVAALTWSQTVNGVAALWLETALLFVAAYVLGWLLAAIRRRSAALPEAAAAVPAAAVPAAAVPAAVGVEPAVAPALEAVTAMPKVEGEDDLPGLRPAGFAAARDGKPDDLKLIKGVGRQNEGRLHGLGIWHFDQIAAWTPQNFEWIGGYLAFPGRIEREGWVAQARALGAGAESVGTDPAASSGDGNDRDNVVDMTKDGFEGERPANTIEAARDGEPDDLELIKGIGPAIAADLNRLGIWHFDQLAELREAELRYVSAFVGYPSRGVAEKWNEEADILRHGGETAHSRAVKAKRDKAEG